ncbi:MAG: DUF3846 domain-containing protein [Bacteroidaceae bacterium]|nr:DUF3846 domain-containing protein [Bacteroidaceae bacterium]
MRVKIYQISHARDIHNKKFISLGENEMVDPSTYDEVFNAELDESDLEAIYTRFNTEGHPLHRGHSLSVSDVVVVEDKAYICQSVGFKEVEFDELKTQKPDNLMRVVYVEPNKPAYVAEVEHTLKGEQRAVKGLIKPVYIENDGTCLICNEEAKLEGMEGNRRFGDGSSIIAGPFFVVGLTEDDFRGLTDKEVMKYMDRFSEPEQISQEEVQGDMGITIITGM